MINKILAVLLMLILVVFTMNMKYIDAFNNKTSSLVVCAYNENIDWIESKETIDKYTKIFVYIKNKDRFDKIKKNNHKKIKYISLDNIGSCDFVYLHHIINHYSDLTDIVTFSKGTYKKNIPKYNIISKSNSNNNNSKKFSLNYWNFSNNKNLNFKYQKSEFKNLEDYLLSIFKKESVDKLFSNSSYIIYAGWFTVSKDNIHRYKKKIYEKLINYKGGPNREIDHFHERIWGLLFSNTDTNIELLK